MSHEKQREIFNRLVNEKTLEFSDIKDKIDHNRLVYVFSTDKDYPNDFGNYQMSIKLFEDLRDSEIKPKEVWKYQARLKADLSEIKTGGKKSADQKNKWKNITNVSDLRE